MVAEPAPEEAAAPEPTTTAEAPATTTEAPATKTARASTPRADTDVLEAAAGTGTAGGTTSEPPLAIAGAAVIGIAAVGGGATALRLRIRH